MRRRAARVVPQLPLTGAPDRTSEPVKVTLSLLSQDRNQFTGTRTYVRELVRHLSGRREEIELTLFCNEHAAAWRGDWYGESVPITIASGYRVGDSRMSRVAALVAAQLAPQRLARQVPPATDVVHYPLIVNVPRVPGPTVTTLHDVQHHELPQLFSPAERLWRRLLYDRSAAGATMVITDSDHARRRIIEIIGVDPSRVITIHLAVDHELFSERPGSRDEALLAGIVPERFILYPASLWPHKNHDRLLEALALVEDRSLELVLTGAAFGKREALMASASRFGVGRRVHHLGFVPDQMLAALYRAAQAVVFPSLYEGFGAPPLEAMACGCPVASSLVASLREVCGDAVEPLDPHDPRSIAAAIMRVTEDPQARAVLRERGFRQAGRFSWAAAAKAHLAVYREAAERGR